jgi:hypothetical protein
MGRSISNYSKFKTSDIESFKSSKKKVSRKKNKNLSKWGKNNSQNNDNSSDSFVLQSPHGVQDDEENYSYRSWE